MKLVRAFLARRDTNDAGVALVAAVAVAVIGVAISLIVVSLAISVTRDTARDRLRTLEVHSAESGLDTAMAQLATTSPCPSPSWSPATSGSGATATKVTVTIKYFNAAYPDITNPIPCNSGVLAEVPTSALITSVAVPTTAAPGIAPKRTSRPTSNLFLNRSPFRARPSSRPPLLPREAASSCFPRIPRKKRCCGWIPGITTVQQTFR